MKDKSQTSKRLTLIGCLVLACKRFLSTARDDESLQPYIENAQRIVELSKSTITTK